ncbi:MAG: outer membrane protein assembly factor BamE [Azoarcus sp.]|nr:outer membrane protein assembly factor BamE [Azoarcus sp.]
MANHSLPVPAGFSRLTRRLFPALATGLVIGALSACSSSFDSIARGVDPYRIDVRQGNHVDQAMLAHLKRGMSREQVRFVLGSPLMVDVFRTDRWDYVYRFQPGKGEAEQRVISVFFVDDRLDHVEGDVIAGEVEALGTDGASPSPTRTIEIPPASEK